MFYDHFNMNCISKIQSKREPSPINPDQNCNYIAFFFTLKCNLSCGYCINLHDGDPRHIKSDRKHLDVEKWIEAANRLNLREDLPLTIQGGEPTLHKGFFRFVNDVNKEIKMDLLTNMMFNVKEFINNVPVWRFTRKAPYASIRVSYHPGQNKIDDLIQKTFKLQDAGYKVGLYGILNPDKSLSRHIKETQEKCLELGIDFRTKEFLGVWNGKLYGTYRYKNSVERNELKYCECKTTELLVDPEGYVYRCHSDLYSSRNPVNHILDTSFSEKDMNRFRSCRFYGACNPCDVKIKTNRLQIFGHSSVEVKI